MENPLNFSGHNLQEKLVATGQFFVGEAVSLKSTLKSMLKRTLKRQVPYLIGGTITGIIISYYYGFIVAIIVNSAIWFVISTVVNKYYWNYTGFKEECTLRNLVYLEPMQYEALYNNTKYNLVLSYTLSIIL